MSDNTQDKKLSGRGVFSKKWLFFNILPVALGILALVSLLISGLAWLGAFGSSMKELVHSGGFFGNPLAIILYIVIVSSLGFSALSAVVVDRLLDHRRVLINKGIDELRTGTLDRVGNEKLIAADRPFYEKLEEISSAMQDMEEQDKIYARDCSAAQADRDQLSFNLLSAKASPAMVKRVLDYVKRAGADGDARKMVRVSELMTKIIDSILVDAQTLVPMGSELGLIRDYLDLEEIVSGQKIQLRTSIMCNITDYKLLPNVILPILSNFVEAARRDTRIGKYEISLELSVVRGHMLLILRDNGSGVEESELHRLRSRIDSDAVDLLESEISLPSINRRIKLYYGADCGVKLSSSRLGTVVKLYMPVQTNDTV